MTAGRRLSLTAALFFAASAPFIATGEAAEIILKRDEYGMAHVYADNTYDLFYGYGYAAAQDRLYSLDIARRSATGYVAEVLGKDFLDYDQRVRSEYWPDSIREQIKALPPEDKDILDGYAAGFNVWIEKVLADSDNLLPHEYAQHGFDPAPWAAFDVAMVFVGSMLNRYGDFNSEVENAALLQALEKMHGKERAQGLFNTLLSQGVEDAPTTIPQRDWDPVRRTKSNLELRPIRGVNISPDVLDQLAPIPPIGANTQGLPRSQWRATAIDTLSRHGPQALGLEAASNMSVIGKAKLDGAQAVMLNGPQFAWFRPAYTYSIGLHGAGFDVVGNTALAYPAIMFAHNGQISWGSTWAAGDQVDLYAETLNPDKPSEYRHKGEWRAMESREERIDVKDSESRTFTAYRSVHGPIVARDDDQHIAYAKKRAWSGAEVDTLFSWVRLMKASNFEEFREAVSSSGVNVNNYYADVDGNVGYVFGGFYPKRVEAHDSRLPASGEGDLDWEGIMPFETNPQVLNPSNHMVINWNNRPAEGFPNPDEWWYSWMLADRVTVLFDEFEAKDRFTPEEVWNAMIGRAAYVDPNAKYLIPFITEATADLPADDERRRLADMLADWDHMRRDEDGDGLYDATAATVMQIWLETLLADVFSTSLPEPYDKFFAAAGYPDPEQPGGAGQNLQVGMKVLHYNLSGHGHDFFDGDSDTAILSALSTTWNLMNERYGADIDKWHAPVGVIRYSHKNFLGIPQTLPDRETDTAIAMNRGTENNMIIFSEQGVRSVEVVPPGQSGFIAPDGSVSANYDNQAMLYESGGSKSVLFDAEQVDAGKVSEEVLISDRE